MFDLDDFLYLETNHGTLQTLLLLIVKRFSNFEKKVHDTIYHVITPIKHVKLLLK